MCRGGRCPFADFAGARHIVSGLGRSASCGDRLLADLLLLARALFAGLLRCSIRRISGMRQIVGGCLYIASIKLNRSRAERDGSEADVSSFDRKSGLFHRVSASNHQWRTERNQKSSQQCGFLPCPFKVCGENSAMSGADWRSESAYQDVKKAETIDIAWEWLRRDGEYRQDFRGLLSSKHSSAPDHFRRKWGLMFPR